MSELKTGNRGSSTPVAYIMKDCYFVEDKNSTSTSEPDCYIKYKMSSGDKLGPSGGSGCGFIGWAFIILMVL